MLARNILIKNYTKISFIIIENGRKKMAYPNKLV